MVSDDVYIGVSPVKPRKWQTQSALNEILIYAKPPTLFVCSHLRTTGGFLSRAINLSSNIRRWPGQILKNLFGLPLLWWKDLCLKSMFGNNVFILVLIILFWTKLWICQTWPKKRKTIKKNDFFLLHTTQSL